MALWTALRAFTLSKGGFALLKYSPFVRGVSMAATFTPGALPSLPRADTGMLRDT